MSKFVIAVLVDNKPGVLMRVTSMFTRRGFNIDSLTVSTVEDPDYSRITITISGDENTKNQFVSQMKKLYNVKKVQELGDDVTVKRELMLIKVKNESDLQSLADQMQHNIKNNQWICGFPEYYVIMHSLLLPRSPC